MLYSAYLGPEHELSTWIDVVERHAAWLGLRARTGRRPVAEGQVFVFTHMTVGDASDATLLPEDAEHLVMSSVASAAAAGERGTNGTGWSRLGEFEDNAIKIGVGLRSGEIRVAVPPTTPEQFYYRRHGGAVGLANDLRLLMRWAPTALDERAVYGLLQYGAIPAPFTPAREVQRVPTGHVLILRPRAAAPDVQCCFDLAEQTQALKVSGDPVQELWRRLDRTLATLPSSTVVYFSGGVDSGLMAARLVALGRTDVTLFNYSFGAHDEEAQLAMRMAAHFGLRCEQATYRAAELPALLARLGRDYSFPYSDISTIPSNLLVHASLPLVQSAGSALEGTGADGTFGLGLKQPQWQWLYRVPRWARRALGEAYRTLGLWRADSIAGQVSNLARRSVQMPLAEAAVLAHNALDGIAYTIPPALDDALDDALRSGIHAMSRGLEPRDRFSFLDMVHVCSGLYAVKVFEPLRSRGVATVFPFLEPSILRAGFALDWDRKCAGGIAKRLLKDKLVESVPREMVFRPKRGFRPPLTAIFATPAMQDFIAAVVTSTANPLRTYCDPAVLAAIVEQTRKGAPLSTGVYQFLWSMTFFSGWLQQLKFAHS